MKPTRRWWRLVLASLLVSTALCTLGSALGPATAHAAGARDFGALVRPGGGNTYGGGSRSGGSSSGGSSWGGGSSSGGGGGDLIGAVVWLCFEEPVIGLPLLFLLLGLGAYAQLKKARQGQDWSSGADTYPDAKLADPAALAQRAAEAKAKADARARAGAGAVGGPAGVRNELERLRQVDPEFSLVLFEDFVYALYAAAHEARGGSKLYDLRAYLGDEARATLAAMACAEVEGVVIGSMRPERVDWRRTPTGNWVDVVVAFESNYTETDTAGRKQTYYVRERWKLSRKADAKSKPPVAARVFGCPNCGAPYDKLAGNRCSYCDHALALGECDWAVARIVVDAREPRPPQLTGDAPEVGTDDPTVVVPGAEQRYRQLCARDPNVSWRALQQRVRLVFAELQQGWSTQNWELVRPFVSDQLFQMQLYWIETYRRAKLRNVTENSEVASIVISDVRSDKHYDALTVRLFASGLDYTLDEHGKVVSGSKTRERAYSEYWTFIRGASVQRAASTGRECPNCGAPLAVNMAGSCQQCRAKVTSGEFDWVLSRIEQDESYR